MSNLSENSIISSWVSKSLKKEKTSSVDFNFKKTFCRSIDLFFNSLFSMEFMMLNIGFIIIYYFIAIKYWFFELNKYIYFILVKCFNIKNRLWKWINTIKLHIYIMFSIETKLFFRLFFYDYPPGKTGGFLSHRNFNNFYSAMLDESDVKVLM